MWREFTKAWEAFRWADATDILVVSILAYTAINWFRRTRSRFVVSGFAALVGLYFAAELFGMHLTLAVFQAVIGFALIALVVIFQEEIRRMFERIVSARPFYVASSAGRRDLIETVARAVATMANAKTGALLVVRGKAPLDRHLTGGQSLDAVPSEPLFYSIFDPHSAGHDGAVVLESGRLIKFAVHLPLSQGSAAAHLGTRHCAAVGLSERTDAFVIVVSEERGTISIAQEGTLEVLPTATELAARLASFLETTFPVERRSFFRRLVTTNLRDKTLAVLIAAAAWLVVAGEESELVARTFSVPIQYRDIRRGVTLDAPQPNEIRVTLRGSQRDFRQIDASALRVSIDASALSVGRHVIPLTDPDIERPRDVDVQDISPDRVIVWLREAPGNPK